MLTDGLARGTRHRLQLPCGGDLAVPILIARGARPGRTLVTTAAVHGDEYDGTRAILDLFDQLDPAEFTGDWVAVPAANPPAFWNGTRTSPVDGGNLARVFPGSPAADAPATERLAWHLGESVITLADFYLDLHSGGVGWSMPTMAGYDATDPRSEAAARLFGAETIWGHPDVPPGRTVSFAKSRGIPFLYTEARGGGRIHAGDVAVMKRGIRNLLRHLGILASPLEAVALKRHLFGEGNIHCGINAPAAGFFMADVQLLDEVRAGQPLGKLVNLHGETLAAFSSPRDGVVGLLREFPAVRPDDPLFLIAETRS
ncbi:MAG: succinylglutamate desuccinylase/aspartoacylase family protein [Bryobacterales bacterium]|nr:succinylglutamate desuccinylase/aspartoacylase family protein [Bryobacterales bacterium]